MPGGEAGLADQRRLLVAGHPGDRHAAAEEIRRSCMPNSAALSRTSGSSARGMPKQREQLVVPVLAVDVEEQGARGVGRVGRVHRAAGQAPEQEAVDRAEGELAALGRARGRPATLSSSQAILVAEK